MTSTALSSEESIGFSIDSTYSPPSSSINPPKISGWSLSAAEASNLASSLFPSILGSGIKSLADKSRIEVKMPVVDASGCCVGSIALVSNPFLSREM